MKWIKRLPLCLLAACVLAVACFYADSAGKDWESKIEQRNAQPFAAYPQPAIFTPPPLQSLVPEPPAPPRPRTRRSDPYLRELQRANDIAEAAHRAALLESVRMRPIAPTQPTVTMPMPRGQYDALLEMRRANDTLERLERDAYYDSLLTR